MSTIERRACEIVPGDRIAIRNSCGGLSYFRTAASHLNGKAIVLSSDKCSGDTYVVEGPDELIEIEVKL